MVLWASAVAGLAFQQSNPTGPDPTGFQMESGLSAGVQPDSGWTFYRQKCGKLLQKRDKPVTKAGQSVLRFHFLIALSFFLLPFRFLGSGFVFSDSAFIFSNCAFIFWWHFWTTVGLLESNRTVQSNQTRLTGQCSPVQSSLNPARFADFQIMDSPVTALVLVETLQSMRYLWLKFSNFHFEWCFNEILSS